MDKMFFFENKGIFWRNHLSKLKFVATLERFRGYSAKNECKLKIKKVRPLDKKDGDERASMSINPPQSIL